MLFQITVALAAATSLPECSITLPFESPSEDRAVVLARASGQTEVVPATPDPLYGGTLGPPVAHRFEVVQAAGGSGLVEAGDTFLAVPWGYGDACERLEFEGEWVPEGEIGLFYVVDGTRVGQELVIHVPGGHLPYPQGAMFRYYMMDQPDRSEWLTASDLFSLLNALPADIPDQTRSAEWRALVEAAFRQGPERWTDRFPGNYARSEARRRMGSRPGGSSRHWLSFLQWMGGA